MIARFKAWVNKITSSHDLNDDGQLSDREIQLAILSELKTMTGTNSINNQADVETRPERKRLQTIR